jgi:hypothetical protein
LIKAPDAVRYQYDPKNAADQESTEVDPKHNGMVLAFDYSTASRPKPAGSERLKYLPPAHHDHCEPNGGQCQFNQLRH